MTEQTPTAYIGPHHDRWRPRTWQDIVEAVAGGLLDESHWLDLKQELPAGKPRANTDLAKDLASLAVDGGLLVVGIKDEDSRAGEVCGTELGGLADRVDQVARSKVQPPLMVRSVEIADPDHQGRGCLVIHVPASPQAPHMVDYCYYGRGDRANMRLSDEQVRLIAGTRAARQGDVLGELDTVADDDPMAADDRENGHLHLLLRPVSMVEDTFVPLLTGTDFVSTAVVLMREIDKEVRPGAAPRLSDVSWKRQHAEGVALSTVQRGDPVYEAGLVELVVRENGGISATCGRGTDRFRRQTMPESPWQTVVFPALLLGITHATALLAGRLADQCAGYQGQWDVGVRLDRLDGAVAYEPAAFPFGETADVYRREVYQRATSTTTAELIDSPHQVVERLYAPLLRSLGVGSRYLPYTAARLNQSR